MNIGDVLNAVFSLLSSRMTRQIEKDPEFRRELLTAFRKLVGYIEELEHQEKANRWVDPAISRKVDELRHAVNQKGSLQSDVNWKSAAEKYAAQTENEKPERERISDDELRLIQERCTLKSKAVRWCITRQFHSADGPTDESDQMRRELIEQAKTVPDCYLWMLRMDCDASDTDKSAYECWENLAECFENLALVAELVQAVLPYREEQRDLMELAVKYTAEAQSALRVAVYEVGNKLPDPDQEKCFWWLRRTTEEQRIFVERHMRWNDPADASAWLDLRERIEKLNSEFHERLHLDRQVPKLLNRARFHVKMIEGDRADPEGHDWKVIADCVRNLLNLGIKPSHTAMRELLFPIRNIIEQQPPDIFQTIQPVLDEIRRYESLTPAAAEGTYAGELTEEVDKVRQLVKGKKLVMLGGIPQQSARQSIVEAFELEDLIWIDSRAHESVEHFRPYVYQPNVAAFLLLIRWCSHAFGALEDDCQKANVPFIRITGGYSPNQIAHQILAQAEDKLRSL